MRGTTSMRGNSLLSFILLLALPIQIISFLTPSPLIVPGRSGLVSKTSSISLPISSSISLPISSLSSTNDEFIDYILNPPNPNDPSVRCTHMIGIPLEQNHDLLLELESIQRAVLYHCPLLINACIAPVVTRMPLLLVDTKAGTGAGVGVGGGNASKRGKGFDNINVDDLFGRSNTAIIDSSNGVNDNNDVSTSSSSSPGENELLTSRDPITRALHQIVNDVINEMINIPTTTTTATTSTATNGDENEEEDENRDGANKKNVQPILMKFKGLEIDGDQNEILHAIGSEEDDTSGSSGTSLLRRVLNEISTRIETQKGWRVYIPNDNPQGKVGGLDEDGKTWRPRIPFMRLPYDFYDTLPDPKGYDGDWANYSDAEKERYMRDPEEGGNGISPLFWFKWWEDKLCNGNSVRIREIAVYGRTGPMGMTEQAFYIPHLRTKLPDGNDRLQQDENKDREYDNERRLEQEFMIDGGMDGNDIVTDESTFETMFEKDMATYKSNADRRILQTIFDSSPGEDDNPGLLEDVEGDFDYLEKIAGSGRLEDIEQGLDYLEKKAGINTDDDAMDNIDTIDTMEQDILNINIEEKTSTTSSVEVKTDVVIDTKQSSNVADVIIDVTDEKKEESSSDSEPKTKQQEIIQSIAKPMATGDWTTLPKKDKPKPEDNPILRNWKQRVKDSPNVLGAGKGGVKQLPPFPSDEHFAGIWRLDSIPGRSTIEENIFGPDNPNSSENIVLRIDGTTAGGPILDVESQHRAAGGTWKFFQAQWVGPTKDGEDPEEPVLKTRLRIRLLIPPLKEKILVMEGEVTQGARVSAESISRENINELRKSSFGAIISKEQIASDSTGEETFLQCSGEIWTEGVRGKERDRVKLGRFRLSKKMEQGSTYNYSIPSPQRYQD